MCLPPYPSLSPAQPSTDEEEGERQSPPLEVSDGEADGLEPGPGLLHGETGRGAQPQTPFWPYLCPMPTPAKADGCSSHTAELSVGTFANVCVHVCLVGAPVTVCTCVCL